MLDTQFLQADYNFFLELRKLSIKQKKIFKKRTFLKCFSSVTPTILVCHYYFVGLSIIVQKMLKINSFILAVICQNLLNTAE